MLNEAEGDVPTLPRRRPLAVWIIPDIFLALALATLLALPILLVAGIARRAQGLSLYANGTIQMSSGLFFALVLAQNLAFVLVVLLRVVYLRRLPLRWLGLVAPQPQALIGLGLGAGFGFLVLNILMGLAFSALGIEQNQSAQYPLHANDPVGQALILIVGALLAPVVEELFFRGYIYGALRDALGITPAILISAALFSLAHLLSATQGLIALLIPVFLLGIVLAYLRERSGSLLPCIIAHMVNNAVGMALLLYCINVPGESFCSRV